MKKFIIIFLAIILVLAFLFIPFGQGDIIDSTFGEWKLEVEADFADGTNKTLTVVNNFAGQILAFTTNDGSEVTGFTYKLSAKATGSGYTGCELNCYDLWFNPHILSISAGGDSYQWTDIRGPTTKVLPLNGDFETIMQKTISIGDADDTLSDGEYKLYLEYAGDVKYRGTPGGEWKTDWQKLTSIVELTKTGSGGGGGGGNGGGSPTTDYEIIVTIWPPIIAYSIYMSGGPYGSGIEGESFRDCWKATFMRPPGTYDIEVIWGDGEKATKTITNVNGGVVMIEKPTTFCIAGFSYSVDTTGSERSEYKYGDSYLGG